MLITLETPRLVDDLCVHFRRSGFTAERTGPAMVEVHCPGAPSVDQARREVLMHLRVWEVLNPGVRAQLS